MWRLVGYAIEKGRRRQAIVRRDERNRRTFFLMQQIPGIFGQRANLVVALRQAVEQLNAGIKAARAQLGKFLPEAVAVKLSQLVPLGKLHAGVGLLDTDSVEPKRFQNVLPGLRGLGGRNLLGVIGDPSES